MSLYFYLQQNDGVVVPFDHYFEAVDAIMNTLYYEGFWSLFEVHTNGDEVMIVDTSILREEEEYIYNTLAEFEDIPF